MISHERFEAIFGNMFPSHTQGMATNLSTPPINNISFSSACNCACHIQGAYPSTCMCNCNKPSPLQTSGVAYIKDSKTPHKCPVCDGWGKRFNKEELEMIECNACKGNGVLWR